MRRELPPGPEPDFLGGPAGSKRSGSPKPGSGVTLAPMTRSRVRRSVVASLLLATYAALPVVASASVPFPGTLTPGSPANGQTMAQPSAWSLPFSVTWTDAPSGSSDSMQMRLEVNNQSLLGQDGTLADDAQYRVVQPAVMSRGDADPAQWTGKAVRFEPWSPGTYYFQYKVERTALGSGGFVEYLTYVSPVFSFTVTAPPVAVPAPAPANSPTTPTAPTIVDDGSFALSAAAPILKAIIRDETKRRPTMTRSGCRRGQIETEVSCTPAWSDSRYKYVGRMEMTRSLGDVSYGFEGWRATKSCLKKRTFKKCRRSVAWNG